MAARKFYVFMANCFPFISKLDSDSGEFNARRPLLLLLQKTKTILAAITIQAGRPNGAEQTPSAIQVGQLACRLLLLPCASLGAELHHSNEIKIHTIKDNEASAADRWRQRAAILPALGMGGLGSLAQSRLAGSMIIMAAAAAAADRYWIWATKYDPPRGTEPGINWAAARLGNSRILSAGDVVLGAAKAEVAAQVLAPVTTQRPAAPLSERPNQSGLHFSAGAESEQRPLEAGSCAQLALGRRSFGQIESEWVAPPTATSLPERCALKATRERASLGQFKSSDINLPPLKQSACTWPASASLWPSDRANRGSLVKF